MQILGEKAEFLIPIEYKVNTAGGSPLSLGGRPQHFSRHAMMARVGIVLFGGSALNGSKSDYNKINMVKPYCSRRSRIHAQFARIIIHLLVVLLSSGADQ